MVASDILIDSSVLFIHLRLGQVRHLDTGGTSRGGRRGHLWLFADKEADICTTIVTTYLGGGLKSRMLLLVYEYHVQRAHLIVVAR
jgi:hypothetical protein